MGGIPDCDLGDETAPRQQQDHAWTSNRIGMADSIKSETIATRTIIHRRCG